MAHTWSSRSVRLFVSIAMFLLLVPSAAVPGESDVVRTIVVFENGAMNARAMHAIERLGGVKLKELPMVDGAAVMLPSKAAERAVAKLEGVAHVEPDIVFSIDAKRGAAREVAPWGVDRINADAVWATTSADAVKVAVLDTGVDYLHPDLAANVVAGTSTVNYTPSFVDDNGHGTHVSGIIAAPKNGSGIIGVAPDADLYVAKVLDSQGNGYLSDIIEGLQWAVARDVDVLNMSLGSPYYSSAFDSAVQQAIASGVVVVAAAGNEGSGIDTVTYPAKFGGVVGVSSVDSVLRIAYYSSRGPAVDLAAPGTKINSTVPGGGYAIMSGTSMAAPHVAGAAALVLSSGVGVDDADGDGLWDPSEVEARLERTARDLGTAGFDPLYGNGFLRADVAALQ